MNNFENKIEKMLVLMGFENEQIRVELDEEHNKLSLFIDDEAVRGEDSATKVLSAFNHILNLILKKEGEPHYIVDLNYYRKERERLITKLAKTAARKAAVKKDKVKLPPMNSYERRLVHVEVKTHPELETESEGRGKERHVVIKPIEDNN